MLIRFSDKKALTRSRNTRPRVEGRSRRKVSKIGMFRFAFLRDLRDLRVFRGESFDLADALSSKRISMGQSMLARLGAKAHS
jgi:hypothetical protein